jgi:hypothetical protein
MKPEELRAETDSNKSKIMAALSLGYVRTHASVRGLGTPALTKPNRETLRRQKFTGSENSPYGHIYAGTADPKKVEKRRAKNKVARKSRAQNR